MIPYPIPDWLASSLALYCLAGTALLTIALGWAAWDVVKWAWKKVSL